MSSKLKITSWLRLTLFGALTFLGALNAARFAYSRGEDQFGTVSMTELTDGDESLANLLHSRRATSAAFAAAYAVLFLLVVLIPYRRGEVWSWWAILATTVVCSGLILLRLPFLGVMPGASVGYIQLGVVTFALLLDVGRLKSTSQS